MFYSLNFQEDHKSSSEESEDYNSQKSDEDSCDEYSSEEELEEELENIEANVFGYDTDKLLSPKEAITNLKSRISNTFSKMYDVEKMDYLLWFDRFSYYKNFDTQIINLKQKFSENTKSESISGLVLELYRLTSKMRAFDYAFGLNELLKVVTEFYLDYLPTKTRSNLATGSKIEKFIIKLTNVIKKIDITFTRIFDNSEQIYPFLKITSVLEAQKLIIADVENIIRNEIKYNSKMDKRDLRNLLLDYFNSLQTSQISYKYNLPKTTNIPNNIRKLIETNGIKFEEFGSLERSNLEFIYYKDIRNLEIQYAKRLTALHLCVNNFLGTKVLQTTPIIYDEIFKNNMVNDNSYTIELLWTTGRITNYMKTKRKYSLPFLKTSLNVLGTNYFGMHLLLENNKDEQEILEAVSSNEITYQKEIYTKFLKFKVIFETRDYDTIINFLNKNVKELSEIKSVELIHYIQANLLMVFDH